LTSPEKLSIHLFLDEFFLSKSNQLISGVQSDFSKLGSLISSNIPKKRNEQYQIECIAFEYPSVFVPNKYFRQSTPIDYIKNFCQKPSNYSCSYNLIQKHNLINVFYTSDRLDSLSEELKTELKSVHAWDKIYHFLTRNIGKIHSDNKLVVFFQSRYLDLFFFKGKKFCGANRFEYESETELIYILLCFIEANNLSYRNLAIVPIGKQEKYVPIYNSLKDYFKIEYFNNEIIPTEATHSIYHYPWYLFS